MQQQTATTQQTSAPADMVEQLIRFDGPPEQFLLALLAAQCRIAAAEAAAILRVPPAPPDQGQKQSVEVVAVYPKQGAGATGGTSGGGSATPVWLAHAAEAAVGVMACGRWEVLPLRHADELYAMEASQHLVLLPLRGGAQGVRGVAAFVLHQSNPAIVDQARQRLELTVALLSLYEMRLTMQQHRTDLRLLTQCLEVLAELNRHDRFLAAAMAMCNHIATTWSAERVSLGMVRGRYTKLRAMSHTNQFSRKMELVQAVEATMEEAVDQDSEVLHPAGPEATQIARSAAELARRHGSGHILTLPLRRDSRIVAAITVERPPDRPFTAEQAQALRLVAELCTARLVELDEHDRWFGARWANKTRKGLGVVFGPTHTWAKLAAIIVLGLVAFAVFVEGDYRVEAPFIVEAEERQVIAAPFDGYLTAAEVKPGDIVTAGQVLARLDTSELRLELAQARAERASYLKQAEIDRRENKIAEAQIAEAEADRIAARIDLLQWKVDQAAITSPIAGTVTSGDLTRQLGVPVEAGKMLMEVAPIDALRAKLAVPENRVIDLEVGQAGELAALASPGDYVPFEVERIDPIAEVVDGRNVFRVHARLLEARPALKPGMEGVAKVDVDRRSYASIWTRDLIDWIRMKLWL